jgi:hypothetical protein
MHYYEYICLQDLKNITLVIRWLVFRLGFQALSSSSGSRIAANSSSTCSRIHSQSFYCFLGALAELSKADISLIASVYLSVHLEQLGSHCTDFHWIFFFENLPRKFKFHLHLARKTGTLYEDLRTFITISLSVLLKMGTMSGKICRENQNTHFMFKKLSENRAVYETM